MSFTRNKSTSKNLLDKFLELLSISKTTDPQNTQITDVTNKIDYATLMENKGAKRAHGNYSEVYQASWNGKDVALKILERMTEQEIEKEKNILQKLSELKAPNIVKLIGYAKENGHYCLVMEYIPFSLKNHIENSQPFEWIRRYKIMQGIATGVDFLHGLGIIHRDLKSANVLIKDDDESVICDFGLAEDANNPSLESSGTAAWAAPEVLNNNIKYPLKTDIFSMGTTFWEIAAWDTPFKSFPTFQIIFAVGQQELRENIPQECPKGIADLIKLTWMHDPKMRPPTGEILVKLEEAAKLKI